MSEVWLSAKTIVLLVGVLRWQDPSLATYETKSRQDQKLYEILIQRGVPEENIVFLKDDAATLSAILDNLKSLSSRGNEESTFFFYYAGHGKKSDDGRQAYFLNYDCDTARPQETCFLLDTIADVLKANFKGKRAILAADCCYPGNLNKVADALSRAGIETLVLTSAAASNISTGAWTFTQSLNEILRGRPLMSLVGDEISAKNAGEYITYNMTYAESQLSNFYTTSGFPEDFILAANEAQGLRDKPYLGQYKMAQWEGKDYKVRIVDQQGNSCKIHYLGWGEEWDERREYSELKDVPFKTYDINAKVHVEWNKTWYPAVILKREGFFHYIKYEGYDDGWNEWVTSGRIK